MSKETEFKEYDIVVECGCYWVVVDTVDGLGITGMSNLPDYINGSLDNTWVLDLQPKMVEKSSLREYFNHIYGGDLQKEAFTAGYKALLGDIKQPKEYTDKIVENAFNEWLKNK